MYVLRLILFIVLYSSMGYCQSTFFTGGDICNNQSYNLVFNDEFTGDSLDKSKWYTFYPNSSVGDDQCEPCRLAGDGGIYVDSNVVVKDGTVRLIAKRQTVNWFSVTRDYTSGYLESRHEYSFMYGKFEIRCKIPFGMGFWPVFWLWGGNGTEIDVFEFGSQAPYHHRMGFGRLNGAVKIAGVGYAYDGIDYSLDFHVFNVIWDPFFISFNVDSNEVYRASRLITTNGTNVTWCCVEPGEYNVLKAFPAGSNNFIHIIAQLAIGVDGGPFTDAPNSNTILPNQFEIDYIRVYQRSSLHDSLDLCQVTLFPNPVHDRLSIKSGNMKIVRIENVLGQIMFSADVNTNFMDIDVSSFPRGVYIVEVESEHDILTGKFIRQ